MGLWGHSIETWDRWCVWGMWVAAIAGAIAVFAGLFTGIVGHQLSELSQREANQKIAEANARGEEARKLAASSNEQAKASELKLEQLRHEVGPRQLNRDAFLSALNGQPKAKVELVYLRDDPECFDLAQQIWRALLEAKWDATPPVPIPQSSAPFAAHVPLAMTVEGQPSGVTVVAHSISNEEVAIQADQFAGKHPGKATAWTTLSSALGQSLGRIGGGGGGINPPAEGALRVVVAPR